MQISFDVSLFRKDIDAVCLPDGRPNVTIFGSMHIFSEDKVHNLLDLRESDIVPRRESTCFDLSQRCDHLAAVASGRCCVVQRPAPPF